MAYQSLYRKYRPKNFKEVVAQESIKNILKETVYFDKISHAYFFYGPRGVGKTSLAKIFAQAINCKNFKKNKDVCGECEICLINNNELLTDVIEIDAASNNGVNEIRNLKDNCFVLPFKTKYKVYIIDEIHMLSISAFNAFLKILEEPPEHVIFILVTTEFEKIPITILSRCQQFVFKKILKVKMINYLKKILEKENITYEEKVLEEIFFLSEGCLRDALTILEQLIITSKDKLLLETVIYLFSITSKSTKIDFLKLLKEKDYKNIFFKFNEWNEKKINFKNLTNDLLIILKEFSEYKISKNNFFLEKIDKSDFDILNQILTLDDAFFITKYLFKFFNKNLSNFKDSDKFYLIILNLLDKYKLKNKFISKSENVDSLIKNKDKNKELPKANKDFDKKFYVLKNTENVVKKTKENNSYTFANININTFQDLKSAFLKLPYINKISKPFFEEEKLFSVFRTSKINDAQDLQFKIDNFFKQKISEDNYQNYISYISLLNLKIIAASKDVFVASFPTEIEVNFFYSQFMQKKELYNKLKEFNNQQDLIVFAFNRSELKNLITKFKIGYNSKSDLDDKLIFDFKSFFENLNKINQDINLLNFEKGKIVFEDNKYKIIF